MRLLLMLTAFVIALTGCSTSSPKAVTYYQFDLPSVAQKNASSHVFLHPVVIKNGLDVRGLILKTSPVTLNVANYHLWQTTPSAIVSEFISATLNQQLPNHQVAARFDAPAHSQNAQDALTIKLVLTAFYGDENGHAVVAGTWYISTKETQDQLPFNIRTPLAAPGYDALVLALQQGLVDAASLLTETF